MHYGPEYSKPSYRPLRDSLVAICCLYPKNPICTCCVLKSPENVSLEIETVIKLLYTRNIFQ